jgi:phospholipid/cholesterol/gamma-HCH transport system substrate-binding protein
MKAALGQLHTILGTLEANRDDLAKTLALAEPALRFYVNSGGDGPWLGVNAPYLVFPDTLWCLVRRDIGCT